MENLIKAIEEGDTCLTCKHCRRNKDVHSRAMDDSCYHPDIMQIPYYGGRKSVHMPEDFLCSKFEWVGN